MNEEKNAATYLRVSFLSIPFFIFGVLFLLCCVPFTPSSTTPAACSSRKRGDKRCLVPERFFPKHMRACMCRQPQAIVFCKEKKRAFSKRADACCLHMHDVSVYPRGEYTCKKAPRRAPAECRAKPRRMCRPAAHRSPGAHVNTANECNGTNMPKKSHDIPWKKQL